MMRSRFCYTLDVLTDGSEHTGCGTLFLSAWKIPLSVWNSEASGGASDSECSDSEANDSDSSDSSCSEDESHEELREDSTEEESRDHETTTTPTEPSRFDPQLYVWLTNDGDGENLHSIGEPALVARYAISGVGDATARLCADQRFKLASTRACCLPDRGLLCPASDGLGALFLALCGAGAPSLHVVLPEADRGNPNGQEHDGSCCCLVEELATLALGAHKRLDIRTCEVGHPKERKETTKSLTWWKVYEDEHLVVHATSSRALSSSPEESLSTALVYLYSFPAPRMASVKTKHQSHHASYCTLALFPPRCRNIGDIYERLVQQNLPMVQDGIPMDSIDYAVFLDPRDPLLSASLEAPFDPRLTKTNRLSNLFRNCKLFVTLPRSSANEKVAGEGVTCDEGILIRSQHLHRYFHSHMPSAFTEPPRPSFGCKDAAGGPGLEAPDGCRVLNSGTSMILEKSSAGLWDRRTSIWKKELKEGWTEPTLHSLRSFVAERARPQLPKKPTIDTDENEIELEDETDTEEETILEESPNTIEDENEIDLDDEDEEDESETEKAEPINDVTFTSAPSHGDKYLKDDWHGENLVRTNIVSSQGHSSRLLVLGTGSATPSAYRGASGYALMLPPTNIVRHDHTMDPHRRCRETTSDELHGRHGNDRGKGYGWNEVDDEIYLLECGEGISTVLSRHCYGIRNWKQQVRGIWISHAHLDHYGGLPTLLRLLLEERKSSLLKGANQEPTTGPKEPSRKRQKHALDGSISKPLESKNHRGITDVPPVPWVIAPPKVLRYLDVVLDCHRGWNKTKQMMCFVPKLHHDPKPGNLPFSHFENIKVHHNCSPAFGLMVGWNEKSCHRSGREKNHTSNHCYPQQFERHNSPMVTQFLCYSGDTRPSRGLVRACQRVMKGLHCPPRCPTNGSTIMGDRGEGDNHSNLFLIHEATFRDADASMAHQKKHSTMGEAQTVANDSSCARALLTHFSQRYDNVAAAALPQRKIESSTSCFNGMNDDGITKKSISRPSIGLAMDGLWIDL